MQDRHRQDRPVFEDPEPGDRVFYVCRSLPGELRCRTKEIERVLNTGKVVVGGHHYDVETGLQCGAGKAIYILPFDEDRAEEIQQAFPEAKKKLRDPHEYEYRISDAVREVADVIHGPFEDPVHALRD